MRASWFLGCFRIPVILTLLYASVLIATEETGHGKELLHILLAVSSAAEFNTKGVIPAVDVVLEVVNNKSEFFNLSYNNTALDLKVNF